METVVPSTSSLTSPRSRRRLALRASMVCALVATAINLGVYGLGRMTDASFVVAPSLLPGDLEVGALKVVATTLAYLAPGVALLALAAGRSRGVRVVALVAALYALGSTWGPLAVAQDPATGWVLATMHGTTGAVFVAAAMWVHRRITAG